MNEYLKKQKKLLHGGDYNPEQWLNFPEIIDRDFELMDLANINTVTIGMFAWSSLEYEEGRYDFQWLDNIFDRVEKQGWNIILATPSGARPAWMSKKYDEVLRVDDQRRRQLHGGRHNHCYTSPVYRKKTREINNKLAERYGNRQSLLMWHISNEYGGECHCELCQEAFRDFLKEKYQYSLEKLNNSWWGSFWSHTITDWSQIESPSSIGENAVHGLNLDWKRFVTKQTIEFYKNEISPLRKKTPDIPITTNFMSENPSFIPFRGLDYSKFAKEVDIISWDAYPAWHNNYEKTYELASKVGFLNDSFKSMKQQPWILMESTPSNVNWHQVNKAKRPGMHYLSGLQMLAHGSDSNLYFQIRKSRGSSEKFHGAVIDHDNSSENRVFKEVAKLGHTMEKISQKVIGSERKAEVAILYDVESDWALEDTQGFGLNSKKYAETLQEHYLGFWEQNIQVDVITKEIDFNQYKLLVAPMLYLSSEDTIKRLKEYVKNGGTLVSTYITGLVNENDLLYLKGWPKDLKETFGLDPIETDVLYPGQSNKVLYNGESYQLRDYATILNLNNAQSLGCYAEDFYSQKSAITKNKLEDGEAYYIGGRLEHRFQQDFYQELVNELNICSPLNVEANIGVSIQARNRKNGTQIIFIMNFTEENQTVIIKESVKDIETGNQVKMEIELKPYETRIVEKD